MSTSVNSGAPPALRYAVCVLVGMATLWPWNCFLSAADYFQDTLSSAPVLAKNYSSAMMTVSTLTSTLCNYQLSTLSFINTMKLMRWGNYIQLAVFTVLTIMIMALHDIEGSITIPYFVFILLSVSFTSIGSCLSQVGLMALVNVQGSIYANASVIGNALAGVLPSIAMIFSVTFNKSTTAGRSTEAVKYFSTSILMAVLALCSVWVLAYYDKRLSVYDAVPQLGEETSQNEEEEPSNECVSFRFLWSKLKYIEVTIILTFSLTLVFPVFASNIESKGDFIDKKIFIPLAFMIWNLGDLVGRLLCASIHFKTTSQYRLLGYSFFRILFIPLFLQCNIQNKGKSFGSNQFGDIVYLMLQFLFGLTNGQSFSSAYMSIGGSLDTEREKKAASPFTGLIINLALLLGSVFSFLVVYLIT